MSKKIQLLDCTLRDGAYIVNSNFGVPAIKGIIKRMQDANIELIECGWLKNEPHKKGSSFYHVPSDLEQYLSEKDKSTTYLAMIDWDRYDLESLPPYDGKSIDAIRVVFPRDKFREGIALGKIIKEKGYQVYFQAANTLAYSDIELIELTKEINKIQPQGLSVVDTFGAMYNDDLYRIVSILDRHLSKNIKIGFHSHNNQQLSFALSMQFIELQQKSEREIIVDASLCGMGRGAGNATTELVANYLNNTHQGNYDMNIIMDAIDMYMTYFQENYSWGYSTPYFISGMYCAHVNNISYLIKSHRTSAKDMKNIIEALPEEERKKYNYNLLEDIYIDYQNKSVNDETAINALTDTLRKREVLLILPGKTILKQRELILNYIRSNNPIVIGVNAINENYKYDYLFFGNKIRYEYCQEIYSEIFYQVPKIITSNIKTESDTNEWIINFNFLIKRGWEHFDNSGIMCLRLLNKLHVTKVSLAGFDGFENAYDDSYADPSLPHINPGKKWEELNVEVKDMLLDFQKATSGYTNIHFITKSKYMENQIK